MCVGLWAKVESRGRSQMSFSITLQLSFFFLLVGFLLELELWFACCLFVLWVIGRKTSSSDSSVSAHLRPEVRGLWNMQNFRLLDGDGNLNPQACTARTIDHWAVASDFLPFPFNFSFFPKNKLMFSYTLSRCQTCYVYDDQEIPGPPEFTPKCRL